GILGLEDKDCTIPSQYICEKVSCGTLFNLSESHIGTITSPGYPHEFEKAIECTWKIQGDNGTNDGRIAFKFNTFDLKDGDYLEIRHCSEESDVEKIISGDFTDSLLVVPASSIEIRYLSLYSWEYDIGQPSMMHIDWKYETCGEHWAVQPKDKGYIRSPGYPNEYENETSCLWTLVSNNGVNG
ncbi:unnamed protein product, partial [Meganyctiphanes norvegica]